MMGKKDTYCAPCESFNKGYRSSRTTTCTGVQLNPDFTSSAGKPKMDETNMKANVRKLVGKRSLGASSCGPGTSNGSSPVALMA